MQFRILGPLEVFNDAGVVALGGPLPRALLAMLLLHANQAVPVGRLEAALWGEEAPAGAVRTLQVYVSRLRKALGERDRLMIEPAGYRLRVGAGELDAERFERRVVDGCAALAAGELERAAAVLREGLSLWRGPVLADLASVWLAPAEVARLEERRLVAVEARVEAELGLGRHAALVAELQTHIAEHPWRERLHAQLMLALYRSGRQAEALAAYLHARDVLVELGIEPGQELRDLQQRVLVQDPALVAPARRSALPVAPNRTIGRGRELGVLMERLRSGSVRLLTLTGPGGVGKTRLALEVGRAVEADFADGARVVSLAAVDRAEDVPAAIGTSLGVIPLAGESADAAVERFLAAKELLLLVDNCEHLPAAAPFIGGLPGVCPGLTVLATSREPLTVHAEQRFPVAPLAVPEVGALAGVDAVELFCERARAHDPGFELGEGNADAVASICRRVDGLPLAIELAAARCGLLSPEEIADRLHAALGTLGAGRRDAPARQQTLRATIDWSHELLSDDEQRCFARFAVFAGGTTVDAAEIVTGAGLETLERLVAKSLLVRHPATSGPTRLGMLETIRAYAAERFAVAVDRAAVRERHYRVHLTLAQTHGTDRALTTAGREGHLARLDAEVDNLRVAHEWAIGRPDAEPALALCAALGRYWEMRDRYAEAVRSTDAALSLPDAAAHPALRVEVLCAKAWALWLLGRGEEQDTTLSEAEATARALADPLVLSLALRTRADDEVGAGRNDVADALLDEALAWAKASGDASEIAYVCSRQAMTASNLSELSERVDRAAALLEAVGNVHQLADLLGGAAYVALLMSADEDALKLVTRAIPLARELDHPYLWMLLHGNLGLAALFTGDSKTAEDAFHEELRLCRELVVRGGAFVSEALGGLAAIAALRGESQRAARLAGASDAHRSEQPRDAVDARLDKAFFADARQQCGPDTWDAGFREGAALGFEDVIADVLNPRAERAAPGGAARRALDLSS